MNKQKRVYGAYNIGHTFSRMVHFEDWLNSYSEDEKRRIRIDNFDQKQFLYGSSKSGEAEKKAYFSLPMPIHFLIKHRNQGKIDSHKWFFKGFCEYTNPRFTQLIDAGSIPLWGSISKIVKYMDKYQDVGGACGEIEGIIEDKNPANGQEYSFFESVLLKAQYGEYKISHYL